MNTYHLGWLSRKPLSFQTPLNHRNVGTWENDKDLRVYIVILDAQDETSAKARVTQYFPDAKFQYVVTPTARQIEGYNRGARL